MASSEAKISPTGPENLPEYERYPTYTTCEVSTPENQHGTSLQASSRARSRA